MTYVMGYSLSPLSGARATSQTASKIQRAIRSTHFILHPSALILVLLRSLVEGKATFAIEVVKVFGFDEVESCLSATLEQRDYLRMRHAATIGV